MIFGSICVLNEFLLDTKIKLLFNIYTFKYSIDGSRFSCSRESRLGSIINQLRESKEKRKSDHYDEDVTMADYSSPESGTK